MHHTRLTTAVLMTAVFTAVAAPRSAAAWFDGGHRLIAALAWRQMTPESRRQLVSVLEAHPRFAEDFDAAMPASARENADLRGSYLLQIAAVWPDTARDYEGELRLRFDRPRWHYIEWPVFTDADSMGILNSRLPPISFDDPGGIDHALLNAVQAAKNSQTIFVDSDASDAERAVHACWVAHLVGDLHQPCHAASIYSKTMYRTGNKGGNWTPTTPGDNVHLFWDGLLGEGRGVAPEELLRRVEARTDDIAGRPEVAQLAAAARDESRPVKWAAESHRLATQAVYTPDLVTYLLRMEADGVKSIDLPPFALEEAYQAAALLIAERRAVEASTRLAAALTIK